MSVDYIAASTAALIEHLAVDSSGAALTGVTDLKARVRRTSDGLFYDWSDSTFKTGASVTTLNQTMSEVSATYDPGHYSLSWPGAAAGEYVVTVTQTGTTVKNVPATITFHVGALATASALATVQADTDDIQARLPAALVGGRIDASVGAVANNAITAAAIAADAIDGDAIAASAVTELQSGLATSSAQTTAQTSLSDIQGRLPAALVSGRIDASVGAMQTDTLTATALDASAVAEIQSGLATASAVAALPSASANATALLDASLSGHTTSGTAGQAFSRVDAAVSTRAAPGDAMALTAGERTTVQALILSDATPFSGARIDTTISSRSTLTAAQVDTQLSGVHGSGSWATATGFSTHSASDVWAVGTRTLTGIGSSGIASQASVDALPTAAVISDAVWDEILSGHAISGSAGATLTTAGASAAPDAATVAAAVWATAEGSPTSGTMGYAVKLARQNITNRKTVSTAALGTEILYADDATTPLLTQTLRDGAGSAITTPTGSPASRGAAT